MTSTTLDTPDEPSRTVSKLPIGSRSTAGSSPTEEQHSAAGQPDSIASLVRAVNASHAALRDLWSRVRRAADVAFRSGKAAEEAEKVAEEARVEHQIIQAEQPQRTAPLPRQLLFALMTVALDGVACYFAAQAVDSGQLETLVWAGLFLAVLGAGEWVLDHCRDRRWWRLLAAGLAAFVTVLGVLRFSYLATVGLDGLLPALGGAALLTVATGAFLVLGYRALRAAESSRAWKARRWAQAAARQAADVREQAAWDMADWDRLADTYLGEIRHWLLEVYPASEQPAAEAAVRAHLLGRA